MTSKFISIFLVSILLLSSFSIVFADDVKDGWVKENGQEIYYANDIPLTNSWVTAPGIGYHRTDASGAKIKGSKWIEVGTKTYRLEKDVRVEGAKFITVEKVKHYVLKGGAIAKNKWITVSGKKYFAQKNGFIAVGKKMTVGEIRYSFSTAGVATVIGARLKVDLIRQMPELPTGCEITSVTQMLCYSGANVDKVKLAKEMPKNRDPNKGFSGDPFLRSGWTIYPPALMGLVKKYAGTSKNMTRATAGQLKTQLKKKHPIVIWVSGFHGFTVHAIVLTGYEGNTFYYNDCWSGQKDAKISQTKLLSLWKKQNRRAISY